MSHCELDLDGDRLWLPGKSLSLLHDLLEVEPHRRFDATHRLTRRTTVGVAPGQPWHAGHGPAVDFAVQHHRVPGFHRTYASRHGAVGQSNAPRCGGVPSSKVLLPTHAQRALRGGSAAG